MALCVVDIDGRNIPLVQDMVAALAPSTSGQPDVADRQQHSAQLPQQQQQQQEQERDQHDGGQPEPEQQARGLQRCSTGTANATQHEFLPFVDTLVPPRDAWSRTVYACCLPWCGGLSRRPMLKGLACMLRKNVCWGGIVWTDPLAAVMTHRRAPWLNSKAGIILLRNFHPLATL